MKYTYSFHVEARSELLLYVGQYSQKSEQVARNFRYEFDEAIGKILTHPEAYPPDIHAPSCRRYILKRFPYKIIYKVSLQLEHIFIVAIASTRKGNAYWLGREEDM